MIRWGILGCGSVCETKSGPALYKVPGSSVELVMRRNPELAEDYARRHGVRRFTTDARALIDDRQVDAVYIATPPGAHLYYALEVAAAKKPCYVEKPMARSATECRRMLDAFTAVDQPLFVAYYRRALPRFVKLKALIDEGALGRVAVISHSLKRLSRPSDNPERLPWRLDAAAAGGGLFLDLGSHALDLFEFLMGPIADVTGFAVNHGRQAAVEDTVAASLSFESGALGSLRYCFAAGAQDDCLEVVGDRGQVSCSLFGSEPIELVNDEGSESIVVEHPAHVQQPLVETIVAELSGADVRCPSRGDTALRASVAMDRVLSAYYGGRDDDFWARPTTWPGLR